MKSNNRSTVKSRMGFAFGVALSSLALSTQALAQSTWTVTVLHPTGQITSEAHGAGLQQAGYVKPTVQQTRAAVWNGSANSYVELHPDGALTSVAWGASDGQQVGQVLFPGLGSASRASLWTGSASSRVDLNPPGWVTSVALDVAGGQQVGYAQFSSAFVSSAILWKGTAESFVILDPPNAGGASRAEGTDGVQQVGTWTLPGPPSIRAALWSGTAASHVDLEPPGVLLSRAFDVSRGQQVGYVRMPPAQPGGDTPDMASLWTGSAASWVNLNPAGASSSQASGVLNGLQVGFAQTAMGRRASLWRGTAASWVDLHAFLPAGFSSSSATDISSDGTTVTIAGHGFNTVTNRTEALIWRAPDPAACDSLDPAPLDASVEFETTIQAIFTGGPGQPAKCTMCHSPNTSAGLSLAVPNSFAELVGVDSSQDPTIKRVQPFSATNSLLFRKVNCNDPGVGSRMPLGSPTLSLDEQRVIRDWINQGALRQQRILVNGFE